MATSAFSDRSVPGGIVHNPAAPYAREMAKWEMGYSPFGPPGRPRETVGFQPWPALFYKMTRSATNGEFLVEHYKEVGSDREASEAERLGYRLGQAAAIAYVESLEQQIAVAAAERAYSERTMSDKARAEAAAADDATSAHLPEVPVTTVRRRRGPNTPKTSLTPEA